MPPIDPRIRARRIEVRRRAGRRRLRRLGALGGAVGLVVLGLAALRSPLLDVDRVAVSGANLTGDEAVVAASGVRRGDRLAGVPLGEVAGRVGELPWVARATVRRSWPGTLRIAVVERRAVAAAPVVGGGWVFLDADGWQAGLTADVPGWIVRLQADPLVPALGERAPGWTRPLLAVAGSVPGAVVDRVVSLRLAAGGEAPAVEATVRLPDASEATVRLGPPDQLERKWLAVATVLDQVDLAGVTAVDVRVPNAPVVTRR
ncbi:MAG: cell division protein FtsQ/DivIB [Acidimicrobiia bacterium]